MALEIDDSRFHEFAIEIAEKEMREITDYAHREYVTMCIHPHWTQKEAQAACYLRAIQQFLLKRGAKLQFRVKV